MRAGRAGAVILAAGSSSRLGRPKQLLPFRGRSLLRRAAETAREAGAAPVVVVLGFDAGRMRAELDSLPVQAAVCPEWEEGMGTSLRAGIAALLASDPDVAAALVLLCDQPLVTADDLRALLAAQAAEGRAAAAARYGDGPDAPFGPPCVFGRSLFPELLALRGPQGAKQVLARLAPEEIAWAPLPAAAIDIDTADDWYSMNKEARSE